MDNCGYIVQWLTLATLNRTKPVCYSLAWSPEITQWFTPQTYYFPTKNLSSTTSLPSKKTSKTSPPLMNYWIPPKYTHPNIPQKEKKTISTENNIQQLTVSTLIETKESLEAPRLRAEQKDEKKERGFHKLPAHHKLMISTHHFNLILLKLQKHPPCFMNPI